ncbi:unnamed protein product [Urochloa decumbens]|uniref:Uncharacterized protein n=1 Tax=Urochloa decumbens TaxID=240449 RepID=A0ABC9H407_9POAL
MDLVVPSPQSEQQQQEEEVALEHISRMLMEEEEEVMDGHDHPALLHVQQSLEQAAGAERQCASISSMDLLNMAFVRGREEASKLLPREHRLVISAEPDNGARASKLMATAEDEAGVRDMIARMMASDCQLPSEEMEGLRAMNKNNTSSRQQRRQVDMRTLLVRCAQAVDDGGRGARELLRQVRQHASPAGDATQRLAHCFAAALEARLAGGAGMISPPRHRPARSEFLMAYRVFVATCCFEKVAFTFANTAICRAAAGSSRLHVVDYGLHLGFQWPDLLRRLAVRDDPPEVTITLIDRPQPGFRPARHIEETGRSLSNYARDLGVPFNFRAIAAARWDTVRIEELAGAVLAVNSLLKLETLADDSVVVDRPSPRDRVLAGIRTMRPAVFTHGVVNGFCGNSSFFLTRFREALFYYSAVFDVLDATMPRASHHRQLLERHVLGPCAINVVACEGRHRTDRFDSYRQWQLRSRRAGLKQLPLDRDDVDKVRDEVIRKQRYHRDFVIHQDRACLLQGWKGRILYAHSTWVADHDTPHSL